MQNWKQNTILSMLLILFILILGTVMASNDGDISRTGAKVNITAEQAENIYAAGARVTIQGKASEDIWVSGAVVEMNAEVGEDLHAAGARVDVRGKVSGDAFVAGAELVIDIETEGELNAAGASIEVSENSKLGANSSLAAALIDFRGQAADDLILYGDEIVFNGQATGNVTLEARKVKLADEAVIAGDLIIRSEDTANVAQSATISGNLTQTDLSDYYSEQETGPFAGFGGKLVIGASAFLLGILLLLWSRNTTDQMTSMLRTQPGKSILWGLAVFFGLPLFVLLCLISVVGIPVGLTSLLLLPFLILLGFTTALLGLSDWLLAKNGKPKETKQRILFLALSILIYLGLRLIPVLGAFVIFIAMLFGLGAAVVTLGQRIKGKEATISDT